MRLVSDFGLIAVDLWLRVVAGCLRVGFVGVILLCCVNLVVFGFACFCGLLGCYVWFVLF